MLEQYDDVIGIRDLCEILFIGKNRAYELLADNQIKGWRIGRVWKIPKAAVKEYIMGQSAVKC